MAKRSLIIAALLLSLFPALSSAQYRTRKFTITSIVFRSGELIPPEYTCEGRNINPPLKFACIPEKTKSMALIMEDPDVPQGIYVHWVRYNIPPKRTIAPDSLPGKPGKTDASEKGLYVGPCPRSGVHRYYFKIYALNSQLEFKSPPTKEELEKAMHGHILASAELIGLYSKQPQ
ncbi:MAG: YbhB/YbcL family Raf kinase inhibitor-like protein [Candidatus Omnitrophica bacterium]|nr:YbhB/YbcL family Raf kinase inhibitor-like protein [Candidatus Omnitrophota bacterium]